MSHINYKNKLDNPKRREMLPAYKILMEVGLREADKFADIGCGIGYFSIPAAEIVRQKGIVYAMDVKFEMIKEVEKRAEQSGLSNIRAIVTDEYDLKLNDDSISFAFMCTVLHEIEDRIRFINEVKRILIEGGKIVIVEWIKRESDWGPPIDHRLKSDYVQRILRDSGFQNVSIVELNEYFYIVTATKHIA